MDNACTDQSSSTWCTWCTDQLSSTTTLFGFLPLKGMRLGNNNLCTKSMRISPSTDPLTIWRFKIPFTVIATITRILSPRTSNLWHSIGFPLTPYPYVSPQCNRSHQSKSTYQHHILNWNIWITVLSDPDPSVRLPTAFSSHCNCFSSNITKTYALISRPNMSTNSCAI